MAVRVRDMDMPETCGDCTFYDDTTFHHPYCPCSGRMVVNSDFVFDEERMPDCPLEEDTDWVVFQDTEYTRTPKNNEPVIVVHDNDTTGVAWYDGEYWNTSTARFKSVKKWRYMVKVTKLK